MSKPQQLGEKLQAMGYKGIRKECRYKDTSGKKLDAANPQTTGELPFPLTAWEVLRDAKAPRWPRRGVFASRGRRRRSSGGAHRTPSRAARDSTVGRRPPLRSAR